MKVRRAKRSQGALADVTPDTGVVIETIPFEGGAVLVTLDDPTSSPEPARNAFARLRPPEGHPPSETASWRSLVEGIARAVRVVPQARRTGVVREGDRAPTSDSIRKEATSLAEATKDPEVIALVEQILSEVGA